MKTTVLIVLVAAILGLDAWQIATRTDSVTQKWEYQIESPRDDEFVRRANALGQAGWEIVSARRASGEEVDGKAVFAYELILRRPAQPAQRLADGQLPQVK